MGKIAKNARKLLFPGNGRGEFGGRTLLFLTQVFWFYMTFKNTLYLIL